MKRLHSYLTYPYVLFFSFFGIVFTCVLLHAYGHSSRLLIALVLINLCFTGLSTLLFFDLKRVYIDGSTVYIYDLYSRIPYAVELEEIVYFERDNSRPSILWGIYKITVAVEDQQQTFSFMKNKMILNVRKYFEETE